jgi:hypothetical protein
MDIYIYIYSLSAVVSSSLPHPLLQTPHILIFSDMAKGRGMKKRHDHHRTSSTVFFPEVPDTGDRVSIHQSAVLIGNNRRLQQGSVPVTLWGVPPHTPSKMNRGQSRASATQIVSEDHATDNADDAMPDCDNMEVDPPSTGDNHWEEEFSNPFLNNPDLGEFVGMANRQV